MHAHAGRAVAGCWELPVSHLPCSKVPMDPGGRFAQREQQRLATAQHHLHDLDTAGNSADIPEFTGSSLLAGISLCQACTCTLLTASVAAGPREPTHAWQRPQAAYCADSEELNILQAGEGQGQCRGSQPQAWSDQSTVDSSGHQGYKRSSRASAHPSGAFEEDGR